MQSKPDLQPAAVKNPKFRKGRRSLEELHGGSSSHHELMELHKVYKEDDEGKTLNKNLQSISV